MSVPTKKSPEWFEKMKKLLTGQKQVKKVFVMPSATDPGGKINLIFRNRTLPPDNDPDKVIFWMELNEREAGHLMTMIKAAIREMKRYEIENGE